MIDIESELSHLTQQREQEYISLAELLDFLKRFNPKSSFQDIARYLLIKLSPNDIRKTDDEIWGNEAYDKWQELNGIAVFDVPQSIDEKPTYLHPTLFFEALEKVRDFNDVPPYLFDEEKDLSIHYLTAQQARISAKREKIETLLAIKTIAPQKKQNLDNTLATSEKDKIIADQQAEHTAELEGDNLTKHHPPESNINDTIEDTGRVTRPQRLLFSLLVAKNYNDFDTRNSLFEAINLDLKSTGLTTADIKADTFYRLIDDDLPANKEIFPDKQ